MTSRLNSPAMGGGRLLPSVVMTTVTCCPPWAKALYWPPGIDAIIHSLRSCRRICWKPLIDEFDTNKTRFAGYVDAFLFQFESVVQRFCRRMLRTLNEN